MKTNDKSQYTYIEKTSQLRAKSLLYIDTMRLAQKPIAAPRAGL